jgi:hypothetical protein
MDLLNVKDKHGRIQQGGDVSLAFCISPYHPQFVSQIESRVWPYVNKLLYKNYLTINSCEGHFFDDSLEVTVVFYDKEKLNSFVNHFKSKFIDVKIEDVFLNEYTDGKFVSISHKEQTKIINHMFMMSNETYYFVTLFATKEWNKKDNLFFYLLYKLLFKKLSEKLLMLKILSLSNYEDL